MSVNGKDENKLNNGNDNINTSLINDINKNSSIHSLVLNFGFQIILYLISEEPIALMILI